MAVTNDTFASLVALFPEIFPDQIGRGIITHKLRGDFDPESGSSAKLEESYTVQAFIEKRTVALSSSSNDGSSANELTFRDELVAYVWPPATVKAGDVLFFDNKNYPIESVEQLRPNDTTFIYILTLKV